MIEKIRWDIIVLYIDVAFQDLTPSPIKNKKL